MLLGSPHRELVFLEPPAAQGWQKGVHRGKLAPAGAPPPSPFAGNTAGWGSVGRNCSGGTERSGTSRAAASQVKWLCSGISLWRLLFTYAKVALSEEAIGMYSFRAGNTTVLITPCVGTQGVRVASSWTGSSGSWRACRRLTASPCLGRQSATDLVEDVPAHCRGDGLDSL